MLLWLSLIVWMRKSIQTIYLWPNNSGESDQSTYSHGAIGVRSRWESQAAHWAFRLGLPAVLILNWIYLLYHGV